MKSHAVGANLKLSTPKIIITCVSFNVAIAVGILLDAEPGQI